MRWSVGQASGLFCASFLLSCYSCVVARDDRSSTRTVLRNGWKALAGLRAGAGRDGWKLGLFGRAAAAFKSGKKLSTSHLHLQLRAISNRSGMQSVVCFRLLSWLRSCSKDDPTFGFSQRPRRKSERWESSKS
ncbi:hypothetical protein B0T09DRAFT_33964 [Sordaria sp. MPI-SDFR-AT-0083]|nr:hypothetical protein B0T09DRAFT_33964 [Sordaria sp. MPI-SDFR-AT-0083]